MHPVHGEGGEVIPIIIATLSVGLFGLICHHDSHTARVNRAARKRLRASRSKLDISNLK